MTTRNGTGAGRQDMLRDLVAAAPVLWLCVNMLLSLRGLWQGWPTALAFDLPREVAIYVQAGMAVGLVQVLLGLSVLGLAWRRSPRFAAWYTAWAAIGIVADIGFQAAALAIGAFVVTLTPLLIAAASIAISVWTIVLVRRAPGPAFATRTPPREGAPAPLLVVMLNALLGFVLGGAAGLGIGLLAGSVIVDWLDVSCFEGGCGYATAAIGLLGLVAGAIGGLVFAVLRSRGRARPA